MSHGQVWTQDTRHLEDGESYVCLEHLWLPFSDCYAIPPVIINPPALTVNATCNLADIGWWYQHSAGVLRQYFKFTNNQISPNKILHC